MNAGLGLGGESLASLSSVGGNANSSHSDRAWVREETRLIGGGNVTITADKTEIKGAVLASATVDEQGQLTDQGNLTLITDELLVSDIQDRDKSESEGFNLNTGLSSTGSSTLGLTANGHIKEQTTYATLGNGTLQTRTGDDHDLSHTNRDLNATQEITKDQQTRGLDSSVTVDHRVATENGRKAIREDFKELTDLASVAGKKTLEGLDYLADEIAVLGDDLPEEYRELLGATGERFYDSLIRADWSEKQKEMILDPVTLMSLALMEQGNSVSQSYTEAEIKQLYSQLSQLSQLFLPELRRGDSNSSSDSQGADAVTPGQPRTIVITKGRNPLEVDPSPLKVGANGLGLAQQTIDKLAESHPFLV